MLVFNTANESSVFTVPTAAYTGVPVLVPPLCHRFASGRLTPVILAAYLPNAGAEPIRCTAFVTFCIDTVGAESADVSVRVHFRCLLPTAVFLSSLLLRDV